MYITLKDKKIGSKSLNESSYDVNISMLDTEALNKQVIDCLVKSLLSALELKLSQA